MYTQIAKLASRERTIDQSPDTNKKHGQQTHVTSTKTQTTHKAESKQEGRKEKREGTRQNSLLLLLV